MTKKRILKFIESQGVTIPNFYKITGIKRGFLDSDKLHQAVSDKHFAMIIDAFPELSLDWLVSGEGEMLRHENEKELHCVDTSPTVNGPPINYGSKKCDLCKEKDNQIEDLKERILSQEQTIRILLSKIPDD